MEDLWFPVDFALNQPIEDVDSHVPSGFLGAYRPSVAPSARAEVFLGVSVWFAVVNHKARL